MRKNEFCAILKKAQVYEACQIPVPMRTVMDFIPGDDLKRIVERYDKLYSELIVK